MQPKHIIVAVLTLVGVIFGGYNWYNYFKGDDAAPEPVVQALRPPPRVQEDASGGPEAAPGVQASDPANLNEPQAEEGAQPVMEFPDSAGRNPFLTPSEIEAIAMGELLDNGAPQPMAPDAKVTLPEVKLTGLIQDNVGGDYRAIIDGRVYNRGDMVGIEEIVEINSRTVVFAYGGKTRTILLEKDKKANEGVKGITVKSRPD